MKVAASTQSSKDATLYVTLSPCRDCSKLIYQSGIIRVVYNIEYKDKSGINFLKKAGIEVIHIPKI
jgi:dCMP deaminase